MVAQRVMVGRRGVIDLAIQDPGWKSMGVPVPSEPGRYFSEHLQVEIRPNSEFIQIIVTDQSPNAVGAAVQAVVNTHKGIYQSTETRTQEKRKSLTPPQKQEIDQKGKTLVGELQHTSHTAFARP